MPVIPNRSEDLTAAGERKRKERDSTATRGQSKPASIPKPDPEWPHVARMMWDSTLESGGADFFESSDFATLYFLVDQIAYVYRTTSKGDPRNRSPELIKAILAGLGNLLVTEGDRRKLRIELVKPETTNEDILASVTTLFGDEEETE